MSNHFVGHISFFNSYLENTIENQNMVKDFLRQVKAQHPEVLTIDDSDISNMPFFQGCDTVHTMPIPSAILDIISSEYLESDDKLQDFLLLAKEIFNKYAHTNFVPESIQLITLTGNGYDIELFHKNFSKSLNYMMQELISEASNYLII